VTSLLRFASREIATGAWFLSPAMPVGRRKNMPVWRIYPVARPGEPVWQGRKIWKEVLVRASSAAMARMIAGELDRPAQRHRKGNESLCFRSGFDDVKLYWVVRLDRSPLDDRCEQEGVLRAVTDDGREVAPTPFEGPYQSLKPPFTITPPTMPLSRAA
jgi:hypothetical protein